MINGIYPLYVADVGVFYLVFELQFMAYYRFFSLGILIYIVTYLY